MSEESKPNVKAMGKSLGMNIPMMMPGMGPPPKKAAAPALAESTTESSDSTPAPAPSGVKAMGRGLNIPMGMPGMGGPPPKKAAVDAAQAPEEQPMSIEEKQKRLNKHRRPTIHTHRDSRTVFDALEGDDTAILAYLAAQQQSDEDEPIKEETVEVVVQPEPTKVVPVQAPIQSTTPAVEKQIDIEQNKPRGPVELSFGVGVVVVDKKVEGKRIEIEPKAVAPQAKEIKKPKTSVPQIRKRKHYRQNNYKKGKRYSSHCPI